MSVTAQDILNAKNCWAIFTKDAAAIKQTYRALAKRYHPDVTHGGPEVLQQLNIHYERALHLINNGLTIEVTHKQSKRVVKNTYLTEKIFELGKVYIGQTKLIYLIKEGKYYHNMLKNITNLTYMTPDMEAEFSRCLPKIIDNFETTTGEWCVILEKTADVYSLEDLLKQQNGRLDPKHVAWVISRLLNISCYLKTQGKVHNGLSITNCFVSPEFHTILPLGGWWYMTEVGAPMLGTQKSIYDVMTIHTKATRIADYTTDMESIRLIAKQLLGDTLLITPDANIPAAVVKWLKQGSTDDAMREFSEWNQVLLEAWGVRKFIPLEVKEEDIYI